MLELILDGEIDLVINTPYGNSGPRIDGYEIRTPRWRADIPCITTVQGAAAAVQGIEAAPRRRDRGAVPAGHARRAAEGPLVRPDPGAGTAPTCGKEST